MYGKSVPIQEIESEECSICKDSFKNPISLPCDHIFCDECISEWFEKENTCPLCRSKNPNAGLDLSVHGGTVLLFDLF